MRHAIRVAATVLLALAAGGPSARASAGELDGEYEITLLGGLFREREGKRVGANLVLHTEIDGSRYGPVWGYALSYNNGTHEGQLGRIKFDRGSMDMGVCMLIGRDRWAPGGRGDYSIALKRDQSGGLAGSFKGTFQGQAVSGKAFGRIRPRRRVTVEGHRPVKHDEHPRALFRRTDLPRLKAKLQTPVGKTYLARARQAGDVVSLGMLYQLTDRREYAEQAQTLVAKYAAEKDGGIAKDDGPGSGGFGHRLVNVCLAYDLCFDTWPAGFREQLESTMFRKIALYQSRLPTGHANYHPCSNYYGPGRGVPAIASLCLWGVKGPAPQPPVGAPESPVKPPEGYCPGKGVPVSEFASDTMPTEWLFVGGFKPTRSHDPLTPLGGAENVRAEVGMKVSHAGRTEAFRLVSHEKDKGYWKHENYSSGQTVIDITNAIDRVFYSTSYFYTVIRNDKARWVQVATDFAPGVVYVSGVRTMAGDAVRIAKGLHPVLVVAPIGETKPWGRILMRPRLVEVSEAQAKALKAGRRLRHDLDRCIWKRAQAAWQANGGVDPRAQRFVDVAWWQVYQHYRLGIGDGGFQAETGGYAGIASWYPLVYAAMYRNVFGRDASGHQDISHLMPRRMMQVVFGRDGTTAVDKINSVAGFDPRWCAAAWPITPDTYKPALLWAWNHTMAAGEKLPMGKGIRGRGLDMAMAFLHYPTDVKPVHPSNVMPLTWQGPTFGYYCFRSGWQGEDEFVAQVFCKSNIVKGWNHGNAGTFRIRGLGHSWVSTPESRNGVRAQEPVVYLPRDEHNEGACAQVVHAQFAKDGSGALAVDLGDVYARTRTASTAKGPKPLRLYDNNLIRMGENLVESGIKGHRAFAFDYSGSAGVPCLMVLHDRIDGGGEKVWQWQLPDGALTRTRVEGNTFTIDHGGASMKATFVKPGGVELSAGTEEIKVRDARHGYHGKLTRVKATGGDEFLVVITFQRGKAPAVRTGPDNLVRVGKRTIRVVGRKVVVGP